jgi:hypothetical protein
VDPTISTILNCTACLDHMDAEPNLLPVAASLAVSRRVSTDSVLRRYFLEYHGRGHTTEGVGGKRHHV